jgi:serine/threonine protein kinase
MEVNNSAQNVRKGHTRKESLAKRLAAQLNSLSEGTCTSDNNTGHRRRGSLAKKITDSFQSVTRMVSSPLSPVSTPPISPVTSLYDHSCHVIYSLNPDDYVIDETPIGYGSSAVVYRAIYSPLEKEVAIKIIDLDNFERNQIDELRRELQIMTLSKHPHLLPVYCSFVNGARLYIVTPFMSAGSCLDILKSLPRPTPGLDEISIATILKQILQGIEYLHKHGHIHRDIKAGNLLMGNDGTVFLADFGVSSSLMDTGVRNGVRKTFVGTPCWMSPEVLAPEKGYNYKADIWSFGITALELATGSAPYSKYPPLKVLMLILSSDPPSLEREQYPGFSKSFKEMIDLCLQKDPAKRPNAEKLLQHAFFKQGKKEDFLRQKLLNNNKACTLPRDLKKPPSKHYETNVKWDFDSIPKSGIPSKTEKSDVGNNKSLSNVPQDQEEQIVKGRFSVTMDRKVNNKSNAIEVMPYQRSASISGFSGISVNTNPKSNTTFTDHSTAKNDKFLPRSSSTFPDISPPPPSISASVSKRRYSPIRRGRFEIYELSPQSSTGSPEIARSLNGINNVVQLIDEIQLQDKLIDKNLRESDSNELMFKVEEVLSIKSLLESVRTHLLNSLDGKEKYNN